MADKKEGKVVIDESGNRIYYKMFGSGKETLVVLHGGPGQGHEYLLGMEELADERLRVLLYDQLGSGQSDPGDETSWNVPRFVEELETIRTKLDLGRIHLYGHSWGGMLAMQYALDHKENVKSLILSNSSTGMAEIMAAIQRLQADLPKESFKAIIRAQGGGDVDAEQLDEALVDFRSRYLRRAAPYTAERSKQEYRKMFPSTRESYGPSFEGLWGPDPCKCMPCTGPLLDWDVSDRLCEITVPTLIICGWYDEIPPDLHFKLAEMIPDNEFVIFGNSSHFVMLEKEAAAYYGVIKNFVESMIEGD